MNRWIVRKQLDLSLCAKSRKTNDAKSRKWPKSHLGNFWMISRSNISKFQFFLKNSFHSNWKSYLVLTSGQKQKKSLERFWRKISKCLIWRLFREYLQTEPFLRKLRYQPTNEPIITNNINLRGPHWRQSNKIQNYL